MAEIISNSKSKGRKKLSTRIDLTPMVDLGFLLITFFIFTTTMMEPNVIHINMPNEDSTTNPTSIAEHCAMEIFIGEQHKLYTLEGNHAMNHNFSELRRVSLTGEQGIRSALLKHAESVVQAFARQVEGSKPSDKPFILVKASSKSDYGDLVNLIDELMIAGIQDYALVDIEVNEEIALAKL